MRRSEIVVSRTISVVGPSGSGKTTYLAGLLRAAFSGNRVSRPLKVRPEPSNPEAIALAASASSVLRGDLLPATHSMAEYEFWIDLPGSRLGGLGSESVRLSLVDTPGGHCMPSPPEPVSPEVVRSVAAASTLMVVVPADDAVRPSDLDARLRHLVRAAVSERGNEQPFPFERVAVVVTMGELLLGRRGSRLDRELDRMDAEAVVGRTCGADFVSSIRALVPPGGDWYSVVSVFGFHPVTGEFAAVGSDGSWRLPVDERGIHDEWGPYRVFEPIEFLARGVCWREEAL